MQAAEIVELVIAAVEAGDFARLGPHIAPDGVFRGTVGGLEEAMELHGPTAGIEYFRDVANTWDEWLFKAEEVHGDGERS